MSSNRNTGFGGAVALTITTLTKLAGLGIAMNELFIQNQARPVVLTVAAFMMAGAQFSENLIVAFLDRLMGQPPEPPHDASEHKE